MSALHELRADGTEASAKAICRLPRVYGSTRGASERRGGIDGGSPELDEAIEAM